MIVLVVHLVALLHVIVVEELAPAAIVLIAVLRLPLLLVTASSASTVVHAEAAPASAAASPAFEAASAKASALEPAVLIELTPTVSLVIVMVHHVVLVETHAALIKVAWLLVILLTSKVIIRTAPCAPVALASSIV